MHRASLPPELGDAFSVAAARSLGVTASRLRARDLDRPFPGVRALPSDSPPQGERMPVERALAYAHRMTEHQFFTHATAALLWGLPLPPRLSARTLVDVGVFSPRRTPVGAGVRGHAIREGAAHVGLHPVHGVPVASPASVWAQLGSQLRDLRDLVAVADAIVRVPLHADHAPALATREQLAAAMGVGRRVGVARLRHALPRVSERARSRPETWLRLIVEDAGLPAPEVNFDVFEDGVWLAQVDLAFPEVRVALEYEGEHHLTDPVQWAKDIARYERLEAAGWRVLRVTKGDVFAAPGALVARVRAALARG